MQVAFDFTGGQGRDPDGQSWPDRYFFALRPDEETSFRVDRLAHELRRRLRLKGPPRGPEKYHVTLWPLLGADGPASQDIAMARRAACGVSQAAFAIGFDQAACFGPAWNPALVLMASDELPAANALHLAIGEALRRFGIKAEAQSFRPHLTLLYDRRRLASFGVPYLHWHAREFVLVASTDGRPYDILGRWLLQG